MREKVLAFDEALGAVLTQARTVEGGRAVRVSALESSKERARELYGHIEGKNAQQMAAYRELPEEELFRTEWVRIALHAREMPGYKAGRVACSACGEGISYDREVVVNGAVLCQGCAFPETRYYEVV